MLFRFRPSGATSGLAATAATSVAALTIAALTTASPGLAQAPGAEEAAPPQAGTDVMPPGGPATSGQAQPPAAEPAPPASSPSAPPQAGTEVMPPGGPAASGQAQPAAAEPAPPPSGPAAAAPSRPAAAASPQHITRSHQPGSAATAANLNLRRGPGTDSEIVATSPAGSMVHVGECDGEWCAVTWNGQSGYAIARNLNLGPSRQAGGYPPPGQPGYPPGAYGPRVYGAPAPGYYGPPVVYGPGYYYGPRVYCCGGPWGWRRYWW
jgi:hypothetical protein